MKLTKILGAILCILIAATMTPPALAGGIYNNEVGTPEMGTAGAGAEAAAMDASTAIPFYNPAGMTRLDGHKLIFSVGVLAPSVEFDPDPATTFSGGDGGQAGGALPIFTVAYVHSFTERLKFGASLFTAAGAGVDYDPDWVGRNQAQVSTLAALSLSPTLAYKVSDLFSIAGGINLMVSGFNLEVEGASPNSQIKIDGTDAAVSFNFSMLFEPSEKTRVGVTYVSETEFDYSGDVTRTPTSLTAPTNTTLSLAQVLRVGAYHDISEKVAILGSLGWEDWSAMEAQFVSVGTAGTVPIARNWEDTYRYALGLHYRVGDPWLLRFGVTYDTSPTDAANRTADLPVDTQLRLGAGFQHETSESFRYGVELVYADLGDAEINNRGLVGKYKSNDYFALAFNFAWDF
jgi:long-chain fatty acid transport protein